ncbi:hypothetical protein [Lactobacillus xylocopicola]|uniref:Integral membrane protein n=1 Tax=Lactobacillus xylocopicola TaxID=2976676 RepID=A0ABN6SMY6_9LACO|nr:hypothetical protein [Lactobacillus xylocopicola]BDR61128.1 hypothetical protein KIM322_13890 [Lactobacillus xylocopicola]
MNVQELLLNFPILLMTSGRELLQQSMGIIALIFLISAIVYALYFTKHKKAIYQLPLLYSKSLTILLVSLPVIVPWCALLWYLVLPLSGDVATYAKRLTDVWPLMIICALWTLVMVLAIRHDFKMRKKYGAN